jgi:hypothetical protein
MTETPSRDTEPDEEVFECCAFIMNVRHLADAPSYSIAPGHELRRARPNEAKFIKDIFKTNSPSHWFLWEQRLPHPSGTIKFLPESEWRYFVIDSKASWHSFDMLKAALDLAPLELELGFMSNDFGGGYGVTWDSKRIFHVLETAHFNDSFFVEVSASDIEQLRIIHSQLQRHDHTLVDLRPSMRQLDELKALLTPRRSAF